MFCPFSIRISSMSSHLLVFLIISSFWAMIIVFYYLGTCLMENGRNGDKIGCFRLVLFDSLSPSVFASNRTFLIESKWIFPDRTQLDIVIFLYWLWEFFLPNIATKVVAFNLCTFCPTFGNFLQKYSTHQGNFNIRFWALRGSVEAPFFELYRSLNL